MEIPDLVRQELGDEEIQAGVTLGDEDAVCFTPTRTLVYRGEGLLSDEKVASYPHDFERLTVSEGRRKTKFSLSYTSEKLELSVPGSRGDAVLERLLEGKLTVSGGIDDDESISGVFRFSELTLVVTDRQLLKHIGNVTWDADYEAFSFDDVTGLEFEEGSVATAVVLSFNERPERIKAPSEQAPAVRKTLEEALFAYHEVSSLAELNAKVGADPDENTEDAGRGLGLDSGIDPLVSNDPEGDADSEPEPASAGTQTATAQASEQPAAEATAEPESSGSVEIDADPDTAADADIADLEAQVAELTAAVEAQNEQLRKQERTIKQLIKELRQGR